MREFERTRLHAIAVLDAASRRVEDLEDTEEWDASAYVKLHVQEAGALIELGLVQLGYAALAADRVRK